MTLAVINAVWIGTRLGPLHAACLRSFVRNGHRTVLHVYEPPQDLPEGVHLADAAELLPASRVVRYSAGGSPALFANLLRYEVLRKGLGLYVDCDCFCLRPVEDAESIYGWEYRDSINCAVLKLPPASPVLTGLLAIKDDRSFVPPWVSARRRRYYRLRTVLGKPVKIQDMPWGTTGPEAVTWHLKQHGLHEMAAPIDVFYPVHYKETCLLLDPDLTIEDVTTPRTVILHLYNETLRNADMARVPPSSPLGAVLSS